MRRHDVLVVGGGPSGSATALSLLNQGLDVALVTGPTPIRRWAGESLPPGSGELFHSIFGIELLQSPHHVTAFGTRSCWGSPAWVEHDFLSNPLGTGWILDRRTLDEDARGSVAKAGGYLLEDQQVRAIQKDTLGWELQTLSGHSILCRWVIDATGRSSSITRRLGVQRIPCDQQMAFIAMLPSPTETYQGTSIEAVEDGWWYMTPLASGNTVVALVSDRHLLKSPLNSAAHWRSKLMSTLYIHSRLQDQDIITPRRYPAETAYRTELFGSAWAATGDAAISWDPLSSQGISTAVLMGARLGKAVAEAILRQDHAALITWEDDYFLLLEEHEALRSYYWEAETRWKEAPFWKARHSQKGQHSPFQRRPLGERGFC